MMMNRTNSKRGASGCGGALCFAFILALFAVASPYWVWRNNWATAGVTVTQATGSYVASSSYGRYRCGWGWNCYVSSQWNHFDSFNNTMCESSETGSNFEVMNPYGFCTGPNGEMVTPQPIQSMQRLSVATTVLLGIATMAALAAPASRNGGKLSIVAAACCFGSLCTSCATFSVAASYNWYQALVNSGRLDVPMPFITDDGELYIEEVGGWWWGPAFWSTVMIFIVTALATPTLCMVGRTLETGDDLDGGLAGEEELPKRDLAQV